MRLQELLKYNDIVIQCHDNPDADAISSGYGIYTYLKENGKKVRLVYGGPNRIRKSNIVLMVNELNIPIEYVEKIEEPELLVTVDCQYEESNVTRFAAKNVAVIDHHRVSGKLPYINEVRSNLGSCATLVWHLLSEEGIDVNSNKELATALYYGAYTDTNSFAEIYHPLDEDLRDKLVVDQSLIMRLKNANISLEDLEIAGAALLRSDYIEQYRCAVVKAGACDPNILGVISDLVLEVDAVDTCLVFCVMQSGIKLSVRSCVKEVKASELVSNITKGMGSGGGHIMKSGGFIPMSLFVPEYYNFCKESNIMPRMELAPDGKSEQPTMSAIKSFLEKRMTDYFDNCKIIYVKEENFDIPDLRTYKKKKVATGYVRAKEMCDVGTVITARTIDGDIEINVDDDTIIEIGLRGEIRFFKENRFLKDNVLYTQKFVPEDTEYAPSIKINETGEIVSPFDYAKVCVSTGGGTVKAKLLPHNIKIFTEWDDDNYLLGEVGDYLIVNKEEREVYIMESDMFERYYDLES